MRALLAWTSAAALSVLLGVILYSTSLQGSQAGYQETAPLVSESASASATPGITQPESGMAQRVEQPVAPQVAAPPATSQPVPAPASAPSTSRSAASDDSSEEREQDKKESEEREDD